MSSQDCARCDNCPLKGQKRSHPYGDPNYGIGVIQETPGKFEVQHKNPFHGTSGKLLESTLAMVDYDPKQVYVTHLVQCCTPGGRPPTAEEINCCAPRLAQEMLEGATRKYITFGGACTQKLLNLPISKARGRYHGFHPDIGPLPVDRARIASCDGYWVLPTYAHTHVVRDTEIARDFFKDIRKSTREPYFYEDPEIIVLEMPADAIKALESMTGKVCVDIETTDTDPIRGEMLSVGFGNDPRKVYIIPIEVFDLPYVHLAFRQMCCRREDVSIVCQNAGFEYQWFFHKYGIRFDIAEDTMLKHYLLDERSGSEEDEGKKSSSPKKFHNLKLLGGEYYDIPDWSDALDPYLKKGANYGNVPRDILYKYQGYDVSVPLLLVPDMDKQLEDEGIFWVERNILYPGAEALAEIQLNGALLDVDYLRNLSVEWSAETEKARQAFWNTVGWECNINSPKQLQRLLFEEMGLPKVKGTSTDAEVLDTLFERTGDPILEAIKNIRQRIKIQGTYIDGLLKRVHDDNRIRTDFLLHGTATGRLASRNPNLQNQPQMIGPVIRNAFIASPGYELLEPDYSQLEFRVAGFLSRDAVLIDTMNSGRDIHTEVAMACFHLERDEVTKWHRDMAKRVDFGILYGRGADSFVEMGYSKAEGQAFIDAFLDQFQGLRAWIHDVQSKAHSPGYIQTAWGRKKRFPLTLPHTKGDTERQAINSPIQSTASDICLQALTRIHKNADATFGPGILRVLLTVHDSILCEVKLGHRDEVVPWIKNIMENPPLLENIPIPFKADFKAGQKWSELHKF